jgi:hypothetical protein
MAACRTLWHDLGVFSHVRHFSGESTRRSIYCLPMQENLQQKILSGFQLVLRPIVKILLRHGIGYNEFAETVKLAFVEVGSSDFGIRGRPTNISRVAVMTGLTRKEVRRLRSRIENGDDAPTVRTTPITEVLTRWHSENEFLNAQGKPSALPYSQGGNSFSELVKRFGGDVPPGAMRTEMKRMGLLDEREDGLLEVRSRFVISRDGVDTLQTCLVHGVYPLLATVARNTDPGTGDGEGNAQFTTYSLSINKSDRTRLKRICYDRLAESAVSFDDLFTAYEVAPQNREDRDEHPVVMVGLYYFEETDPHAKYKW